MNGDFHPNLSIFTRRGDGDVSLDFRVFREVFGISENTLISLVLIGKCFGFLKKAITGVQGIGKIFVKAFCGESPFVEIPP